MLATSPPQEALPTDELEIKRLIAQRDALFTALEALTDQSGHLCDGLNGYCTGECKDARAALEFARRR